MDVREAADEHDPDRQWAPEADKASPTRRWNGGGPEGRRRVCARLREDERSNGARAAARRVRQTSWGHPAVSTSSTTAEHGQGERRCGPADHQENVLKGVGGANKEPLDDRPVLASDGDPQGTPYCTYENALQSVTPSDVGIHLGGSNECLGAGKGWVIVAPLARTVLHQRHLE